MLSLFFTINLIHLLKPTFQSRVKEVIEANRSIAIQKNINIRQSVNENITITTDENMISTIIRNLVSNAIKFTNIGGEIIVCAKKEETVTIISVTDNGAGINPDSLHSLFQQKQESTTGTNNEKGTGLGFRFLYILFCGVKEILLMIYLRLSLNMKFIPHSQP